MKTLDKALRKQNITSATAKDRWLRGKKVKIIGNSGSHNYGSIGETFTIGPRAYSKNNGFRKGKPDGTGNYIKYSDLVLVGETKEELEKELKDLQEEYEERLSTIKAKIEFLEETGEDEYDENTYKTYVALKTLEDQSTPIMEKAKKLAELI